MFATVTFLCASVFLFEVVNSQCIGNPFGANGYGAPNCLSYRPPLGPGPGPCAPGPWTYAPALTGPFLSLSDLPSSKGGSFLTTSKSPISPSGVAVQTDSMLMEGPLAVFGQLPFLAVVALEGPLPAVGRGAVSYRCGNVETVFFNEVTPEEPLYPGLAPDGVGAAVPGLGYNGYARGCGL